MTNKEADRAAKQRVPIIVTGATAFKIGAISFKRICYVGTSYDDYGRSQDVVKLVDKSSENCTVECPTSDIEVDPDCPDTLKKLVLEA